MRENDAEQWVYEAPRDGSTSARLLTAAEVTALKTPPPSVAEALVVVSLLARVPQFPMAVVGDVLELAGYAVTLEVETNEVMGGRSDMDDLYLALDLVVPSDLPRGVGVADTCQEVIVECTSRDQGWASADNQYDGTYAASYTWSVVKHIKFENHEGELEPYVAQSTNVCSNVRANRRFRQHVKYMRPDTDAEFLSQVRMGDRIELNLRSQYPGWVNTANYGRLRARFPLKIDDEIEVYSSVKLAREMTRFPHASYKHGRRSCSLQ